MSGGDLEPVPFALGMFSVSGSPPFVALVFEDGAAVSLHSVRPLAVELGLDLGADSLFGLLQNWDRTFPQLVQLVRALAHDDRARGHRGAFLSEEFLTAARPVPEARQVFRIDGDRIVSLPISVMGTPSGTTSVSGALRSARPNVGLAAVIGRMLRMATAEAARDAIAGYLLATELVLTSKADFSRYTAPGTLILGPLFVPAFFAGDLATCEFLLALTGAPAQSGRFDGWVGLLADGSASISQSALLLPGDIVVTAPAASAELPPLSEIDVIEAVASGFGRQLLSTQSKEN